MIIRDRLAFAENCIKILYKLRSGFREPRDIAEDVVLRGAVERYLHLALEALIDVGMRLASMLGLAKPERYRDVAKVFRDCGALDYAESRRLELWIGLRNILVHGYAEISYEELFKVLQEVEELESLVTKISRYVLSKDIDPQERALDRILAIVREVLEMESDIVFAYIFGSYATGRCSGESDVDIAIYSREPLSWRKLVELKLKLEDALDLNVDVVDLRTAPPLLTYEVISKGVVVMDRDRGERLSFETRALKEYLDLKLRLEKYYETLLSR